MENTTTEEMPELLSTFADEESTSDAIEGGLPTAQLYMNESESAVDCQSLLGQLFDSGSGIDKMVSTLPTNAG